VLAQVLAALAAAHRAGILHRDIKPGNILFTSTGMTKVADFGIAKAGDSGHTVAGQIVGTVAYLSPQRLAGEPATPSDDLYAVGAVGYEALTGRRAFPQDTLGSLSHAIMTQRPIPMAALRPDADPVLIALTERAMAPRAQWRFGSAEEMNSVLSGHGQSVGGPARPPTMIMASPLPPLPLTSAGPSHARRPPMSRTKKLAALAVGLIAVLVTAAAFIVDSWTHPVPMPVAPTTTTSASTPATTSAPVATITSATLLPPPAEPPKKHGRGKGRRDGGD
jgi:serine/threonine protein kinase